MGKGGNGSGRRKKMEEGGISLSHCRNKKLNQISHGGKSEIRETKNFQLEVAAAGLRKEKFTTGMDQYNEGKKKRGLQGLGGGIKVCGGPIILDKKAIKLKEGHEKGDVVGVFNRVLEEIREGGKKYTRGGGGK